ncbi:hypothetical protein ICE98_02682 [Lactococcus lactis]|nr:hypothetical protein [Lactococcus lactis]
MMQRKIKLFSLKQVQRQLIKQICSQIYNNGSQVGIGTTQTVKQQIIDSGDGSSNKSFASIMDGLNTAWAQNVKQYNPDKK